MQCGERKRSIKACESEIEEILLSGLPILVFYTLPPFVFEAGAIAIFANLVCAVCSSKASAEMSRMSSRFSVSAKKKPAALL